MTLYYGTWKIMDSARVPCMTYFASMDAGDDAKESVGVELLGRWSDVGTASGHFICRAESYNSVVSWLYNWVPMATCTIKPICDDNTAREIVLRKRPSYIVPYDNVGDRVLSGETMYAITYKFYADKRVAGANAFANMTEEQDKGDAGNCRPLGRWHDLGNGSGFAVACARSEVDVYRWANNWAEMCECSVVPVVTDDVARAIIRQKPDFNKKLKDVQKMFKGSSTSLTSLCKF